MKKQIKSLFLTAAILFGISASGTLSAGNSISADEVYEISTFKPSIVIPEQRTPERNPVTSKYAMKDPFYIFSDNDMYFENSTATLKIDTDRIRSLFKILNNNSNILSSDFNSVKYIWQYSPDNGATWYNCTGLTDKPGFVTKVNHTNVMFKYRCEVTAVLNTNGKRSREVIGYSNELQLTLCFKKAESPRFNNFDKVITEILIPGNLKPVNRS